MGNPGKTGRLFQRKENSGRFMPRIFLLPG
jgi:hypothetical protein